MSSRESVPAIYDGEGIRLLKEAPVRGSYHVLVTFVESAEEAAPNRFWESFGAWKEDRPIEDALRDLHSHRRSRTEPPAL